MLGAHMHVSSACLASRAWAQAFTPPPSSGSASGLEVLAAYISANYMGMGKSAIDALPELRRKGISAMGHGLYSWGGEAMDDDGIAQALRLQVRMGVVCGEIVAAPAGKDGCGVRGDCSCAARLSCCLMPCC